MGEGVGVCFVILRGLGARDLFCDAKKKNYFVMDFDATVECTPDRKKDYGKVIPSRIIFP